MRFQLAITILSLVAMAVPGIEMAQEITDNSTQTARRAAFKEPPPKHLYTYRRKRKAVGPAQRYCSAAFTGRAYGNRDWYNAAGFKR